MKTATKETDELSLHLFTSGSEVMSDTDLLGIVLNSPALARTVTRHTGNWKEADMYLQNAKQAAKGIEKEEDRKYFVSQLDTIPRMP